MREIKFEYGFQSVSGIEKKIYNLHEIPFISVKCDVWNVLPIVYVREYTGLKDKNGKEIYEGDILVFGKYKTRYKVIWNNDGWLAISNEGDEYGAYTRKVYHNNLYAEKNYYIEVIGNIYENPELL